MPELWLLKYGPDHQHLELFKPPVLRLYPSLLNQKLGVKLSFNKPVLLSPPNDSSTCLTFRLAALESTACLQ
jgi:hypothetical protein